MKNSIKPAAIALLTTGLLTACVSAPTKQTSQTPMVVTNPTSHTTTVTLALGQQVFVKDQQLNVSFDKIVNDSRCPTGTQCIWAGNATVAVTAMTTTSRPQTLTLSLGDLRGGLAQTQRVADLDITLDSLTPKPAAAQNPATSSATLPKIQLTVKQVP